MGEKNAAKKYFLQELSSRVNVCCMFSLSLSAPSLSNQNFHGNWVCKAAAVYNSFRGILRKESKSFFLYVFIYMKEFTVFVDKKELKLLASRCLLLSTGKTWVGIQASLFHLALSLTLELLQLSGGTMVLVWDLTVKRRHPLKRTHWVFYWQKIVLEVPVPWSVLCGRTASLQLLLFKPFLEGRSFSC